MRHGIELCMAVLAGVSLATGVSAQVRLTGERSACPDRPVTGDLGFRAISCTHCSFFFDPDDPSKVRWEFRSEPVIERIERGGPADGRLQSGDIVVSIDGRLITTTEGGRRFGQVTPGETVVLRVRRGERETDVTIEAGAACPPRRPVAPAPAPDAPGVPVVVPLPPSPLPPPGEETRVPRPAVAPPPAVAPTQAVAPPPPGIPPAGRLGFSLSCSFCSIQRRGADRVWTFSVPPVIESVEPAGPAHAAGLRGGDRLTHLDGVSITTAEGGRLFGALSPGQQVRLRLERDGATRDVELVVGEREDRAAAPAEVPRPDATRTPAGGLPAPGPQPSTVRFTGVVGNAFVQVTGGPVAVTENKDEVVIQSGDITVRIRKTSGGEGVR